jgi:molybdenum-dependent DNA-binding transcriptional regulator ModE
VKEQFLPIGDNQMATDPVSHLSGIAAFVQAVEAGSFTAAAVRLGLSKSAVAKNVAKLEERLGTRLLERTTRSLGLTSDGQSYYESCLRVLAELGSAEALLASRQQQPSGLLRISLPVAFGQKWIMPALLDIGQQYPGLNFFRSPTGMWTWWKKVLTLLCGWVIPAIWRASSAAKLAFSTPSSAHHLPISQHEDGRRSSPILWTTTTSSMRATGALCLGY